MKGDDRFYRHNLQPFDCLIDTMKARSAIPTKQGQDPSSSPRTTENNRRRLSTLFSSLSLGSAVAGSSFTSSNLSNVTGVREQNAGVGGTPTKAAKVGGWLSWLTPAKEQAEDDSDEDYEEEDVRLQGYGRGKKASAKGRNAGGDPIIDLTKRNVASSDRPSFSLLEQLPDEM